MSCFDWFKRDPVGPHLYRKINHLEEENKALKKENEWVIDKLNALSSNPHADIWDACVPSDRRNIFKIILSNEQKIRKMLECELDRAHDEFTDRTRKQKNEIEKLSKKNKELETEIKIYKDFVASIVVILKEEKEGLRK